MIVIDYGGNTTVGAEKKLEQNGCLLGNICKIAFLNDGETLSYKNYETVKIKVNMSKYTPTIKFLNEVADILAEDMIDYLKGGGKAKKITARLVYK